MKTFPTRGLLALAASLAMALAGTGYASANSTINLYLLGNSEPIGSMTTSPLQGGALPNFDERDHEPGLMLAKSGRGATETHDSKYQQWEQDFSGMTVSISELAIWVAPKDFKTDKHVRFSAHLLDCGTSCTLLDSVSRDISGANSWTAVTMPFTVTEHSVGNGRRVVLKITVDKTSEDDMFFAYGTSQYAAHLAISSLSASPTTTTSTTSTSTTSTTTPTTTTTTPTTTTTTPTTTTTMPTTTTTTPTTTTTTTSTTEPGSGSGGGAPTTTLPGGGADSSDTGANQPTGRADEVGALVEALTAEDEGAVTGNGDEPGADHLDSGRVLEPQSGLMVAFANGSETINLYWRAAVALGALAATLLWIGLSKRDANGEQD